MMLRLAGENSCLDKRPQKSLHLELTKLDSWKVILFSVCCTGKQRSNNIRVNMVYYFTSNTVSPAAFIYMGKDKVESKHPPRAAHVWSTHEMNIV